MASNIRQYYFEHIQNLSKIQDYLEQAGIMIANAKSQFCQAGLKILSYICDAVGHHLDTSKVLKILNKSKCINISFAPAFMGVSVYYRISIKNFA